MSSISRDGIFELCPRSDSTGEPVMTVSTSKHLKTATELTLVAGIRPEFVWTRNGDLVSHATRLGLMLQTFFELRRAATEQSSLVSTGPLERLRSLYNFTLVHLRRGQQAVALGDVRSSLGAIYPRDCRSGRTVARRHLLPLHRLRRAFDRRWLRPVCGLGAGAADRCIALLRCRSRSHGRRSALSEGVRASLR